MFDRVVVINLDRRPERMASFWRTFPADWPFVRPERWAAIDGSQCGCPSWYKAPPGAWGCHQSHIAVWRWQVVSGYDSVLVLEDDAVFCNNAVERMQDAIACTPDDWDQIYFGGQHLNTNDLPPEVVVQDRLCRGRYINRTHAYAIRLPFARAALDAIDCPSASEHHRLHHIDYRLGEMHASGEFNTYAPWRFCVGQASGESDIMFNRRHRPRHVREHWWNQFPIVEPVGVA